MFLSEIFTPEWNYVLCIPDCKVADLSIKANFNPRLQLQATTLSESLQNKGADIFGCPNVLLDELSDNPVVHLKPDKAFQIVLQKLPRKLYQGNGGTVPGI